MDLALIRPVLVMLLLGMAASAAAITGPSEPEATRVLLFRAFDDDVPEPGHTIRVVSALTSFDVLRCLPEG